ncbi:MAG: ExbD/TolR family protein [Gammaproteobacteria bacterium]
MNFRYRKRSHVEITLTPMIDVVFLLLIFFMVTTTFNRETELKIKLPEANGAEAVEQKRLVLAIDADGNYYVNNRQLVNQKLSTLRKALLEAAGKSRDLPFVISADAKTPHQAVISALDVAGSAGFVKITFAAKQGAGGE